MSDDTEKIYDFGESPIKVVLVPRHPENRQLVHLVNKPSNAQWLVWGHEIFEERRYFSQEEIDETNKEREDNFFSLGAYQQNFDDYTASKNLYSEIAISLTEQIMDEDGEVLKEMTLPMTPELLDRPIGSKDVIYSLFRFPF